MINQKFQKRISNILIILLFSLFSNNIKAQGPNVPEAASFEPVDATDMVNLVTGDLSYVLPLLNVPSPEGGYPIALSYHAGIAMEQEASWVGLGWSLNPGTINRGVNGYPDDWGKTNVNEFFYDAGWTDDYYDFSAGLTINEAVSVGLGLSWGSNQSLGGYVSASIGFKGGKGTGSVGFKVGTSGVSINGGFAGFNANVGTSGVGIGYGFSKEDSDSSLGIDLNYSYNSGLSGGFSFSQGKRNDEGNLMRGRSTGMGITLSSQGISANGKINGLGAGISTSNYGISGSDYDVNISSTGFSIPIYVFYIGFNHTKVKYSLYKYNNLNTSGILNPIEANELKPYSNSQNLSRLLYENNFMDVNILSKYNDQMEVEFLLDNLKQADKNNLVLPNYDNYSVTAQGLSGSLSPYIHSELNLSGRGRGEQNDDNLYVGYLNHSVAEYNTPSSSGINVNRDAIKKIHFTFNSSNSSFLRMERSNVNEAFLQSLHSDHIMDAYETFNTLNFNNSNSLTSTYEAKKREGNYIEIFTNKEIRESYSSGISNLPKFIDAKQYNTQNVEINLDRTDTEIFLDEGIGAYQITTADGRTYHYSLPVYNFESFYKNFKNENDEDENFFEIQKTTPYATHWLLTAITGPDYIDINNNGTLDENDYGYWVMFDYGKWSDGYVWKTPNGHYKEDENDDGDKTYSYSWGRKQMYYLDAIKTRTHTALFVKDLRDDNLSSTEPNSYNQKWSSGTFDINNNCVGFSSDRLSQFGHPNDTFYEFDGTPYALPSIASCGTGCTYDLKNWYARKTTLKYIDVPTNKTLRLSKILLLKNEDLNYDKTSGSLTNYLTGYYHFNTEYFWISTSSTTGGVNWIGRPDLYKKANVLDSFQIHLHNNVLDVSDIEGENLENKAQQVIELDHDYSLAENTPNSNASNGGRLSLKAVNYKGKNGVQVIPPYKFSYHNESCLLYTSDAADD